MSQRNLYRVFLSGVLAMIAVSILMTIISGSSLHWLATIAAIVVLYGIVRHIKR